MRIGSGTTASATQSMPRTAVAPTGQRPRQQRRASPTAAIASPTPAANRAASARRQQPLRSGATRRSWDPLRRAERLQRLRDQIEARARSRMRPRARECGGRRVARARDADSTSTPGTAPASGVISIVLLRPPSPKRLSARDVARGFYHECGARLQRRQPVAQARRRLVRAEREVDVGRCNPFGRPLVSTTPA